MKKGMFKLMGIIVMGAVIGFFTGCDLTGGGAITTLTLSLGLAESIQDTLLTV